jgi:hypothetical protein
MLVERRFIFCPKRCEFSRTVEEADEFLVPVSSHALADHRAVEDIQRGEHRGRAVPDIIVGHRPGPTLLHRQARLGAVERLNLRLLVDRQHETMGRRVEIQPDDVAQLGGKGSVCATRSGMMNGVGDLSSPLNADRFDAGTGVRTTLRWSEGDSNPRSPVVIPRGARLWLGVYERTGPARRRPPV